MASETFSTSTLECIAQVEQSYASLMRFAAGAADAGGKLLYAGELDEPGRRLAIAGNIAGAATLTASADAEALRKAQRCGAIDFLVNSLDEALRILKNEIRKHEPVAVAVSVSPETMAAEMAERGVVPDLLATESAGFLERGAQCIPAPASQADSRFLVWAIPAEYAQRTADFDKFLLGHVPEDALVERRWLRLSARYLGPQARRLRSLRCGEETAARLIETLGKPLES